MLTAASVGLWDCNFRDRGLHDHFHSVDDIEACGEFYGIASGCQGESLDEASGEIVDVNPTVCVGHYHHYRAFT